MIDFVEFNCHFHLCTQKPKEVITKDDFLDMKSFSHLMQF